ncbi:hypothetical protein HMPREF3171_10870 [Corynebacterium sp. HMSC08F01]|uniref:hypothetical protein n=1 Tax=Corynebacterium sp. HMSC08F01 TaxID=1581139 RepID=UPI0008A63A6A|nr:hypothetical protein [Corynebacterium sp. HMSC08F01]OFT27676.1 hypothetical protein HMPREF3171_10870 [Corynebacterium sp. HMSC08F01]
MGEWKTEIRTNLVDVRGQTYLSSDLLRLSTSHALARRSYDALKIHQQHWARAYCAGLAVHAAVITGRASAYLNDMWVVNTPLDQVALVLPSVPRRSTWPAGVRYVQRTLPASRIRRGEAMSTTSPLQTFLDIARLDGFTHALVAADWLVQRGGFTPAQLQHLVETEPRFPGKPAARLAAQHASTLSESAPEAYARALLIEAGITDVRANVTLTRWRYRVDLLINGWLGVEIDGRVKYDDTTFGPASKALLDEKTRADRLGNAGHPLLRYAPRYLEEHPEEFVGAVRARLELGR